MSTAPTSVLRVSIPGLSALSSFLLQYLNLCFMSMVSVGSFYASFHLCPLPGDREATLAISCTCLAQVLVFHLHVSYFLSSPMVPQLLSRVFVRWALLFSNRDRYPQFILGPRCSSHSGYPLQDGFRGSFLHGSMSEPCKTFGPFRHVNGVSFYDQTKSRQREGRITSSAGSHCKQLNSVWFFELLVRCHEHVFITGE